MGVLATKSAPNRHEWKFSVAPKFLLLVHRLRTLGILLKVWARYLKVGFFLPTSIGLGMNTIIFHQNRMENKLHTINFLYLS